MPVDTRPASDEFAPFYARYVALVPEADVLAVLETQETEMVSRAAAVPVARETYAYAPGKWSIREVIGHLADAERLFGFRAFCIERGDQTALPGFDENLYAARSDAAGRSLGEIVAEWTLVRRANLVFLRRVGPEGWRRMGTASGARVSVRALAAIMAGHVRHHLGVLAERYGAHP
jgi:hypothetical protein